MTTASISDLTGTVIVALPVERAFSFFTESFGSWWPAAYHIGVAEMADAVLEPHVGGRWFERGIDGTECDWGRVLVWEPPHRLVVTWQITGHWKFDADPDRASEIEVRFVAEGAERTRVDLEHRHLDRLVEGEAMRTVIEQSGGGWSTVLQRFAAAAVSH